MLPDHPKEHHAPHASRRRRSREVDTGRRLPRVPFSRLVEGREVGRGRVAGGLFLLMAPPV